MIDPIDSLAFSMEANPGVYALLVGSGVSFSAEIPTGEQITLELIRRLANINKEICESDPRSWYREKFGEEPDYSVLLSHLAKTQNDRFNLLKEFFEPSEEERRRGAKMPTSAHKAIAQLISKGYIKVIITTNFDHLLENALNDIGRSPTIISTKEAAEGALPIVHTNQTIIKVNGDYLDPRIRNTYSELEKYDDVTNALLDRIFDEFGLIVCGWSAEWDIALRRSLERCKNHRFSTYWTGISEPTECALRLMELRRASFILIDSADKFFPDLVDRVMSIESYKKPHPISKQVAVAKTKNYLVSDIHRIEIYDLIRQETERLCNNLSNIYATNDQILCYSDLNRRLHQFENLTETVLAMIITGCFWGNDTHDALWINSIERIGNISFEEGHDPWLRLYPALLLFYGSGIAALANNDYITFAKLLMKPVIVDNLEEHPPVSALIPSKVIDEKNQKIIFEEYHFNKWTALSNYLYEFLREPMKEFLHNENRYQKCFDIFEYLVALQHAYLRKKNGQNPWGPIGCFGWRYRDSNYDKLASYINSERFRGNRYLFDGNYENFLDIKTDFNKFVDKETFGWIS